MKTQCPFAKASTKERKYAMKYLLDLGYTEDQIEFTSSTGMARYDGVLTKSDGSKVIFEVKIRNVNSTTYDTAILDYSKYTAVLDKAEKMNAIPTAMFFYTDGKVMILDLRTNHPVSVNRRWMPNTTVVNTGSGYKMVAEFKIKPNRLKNYNL